MSYEDAHDDALLADPSIRALRTRIEAIPSDALARARPERQAIVEIHLASGEVRRRHVRVVRGAPDDPMSAGEVAAKAADILGPIMGRRADALIDLCLGDAEFGVAEFVRRCAIDPERARADRASIGPSTPSVSRRRAASHGRELQALPARGQAPVPGRRGLQPHLVRGAAARQRPEGVARAARHDPHPARRGTDGGNRWRYRAFIDHQALDILQPNVCYNGGYTETLKVAGMAQAYNMPIANGGGWPLHNLHVMAGLMNGWRVEFHLGMQATGELLFEDPPDPRTTWCASREPRAWGWSRTGTLCAIP